MAAAFAAAPFFLLIGGNLGATLVSVVMIAALVVGIPMLWRQFKAGGNRLLLILLLNEIVILSSRVLPPIAA